MSNYSIRIADQARTMVTEAEAPAALAAHLKADAEFYGVWNVPAATFAAEAEGILIAARAMGTPIYVGSEGDIRVTAHA